MWGECAESSEVAEQFWAGPQLVLGLGWLRSAEWELCCLRAFPVLLLALPLCQQPRARDGLRAFSPGAPAQTPALPLSHGELFPSPAPFTSRAGWEQPAGASRGRLELSTSPSKPLFDLSLDVQEVKSVLVLLGLCAPHAAEGRNPF